MSETYVIGFLAAWQTLASTAQQIAHPVEAEYRFHHDRKWRFDFAFTDRRDKLAVEFDGGQWVANGGRHNRDSDREKLNEAAARRWRVLRFSNQQWAADPLGCCALVLRALEAT